MDYIDYFDSDRMRIIGPAGMIAIVAAFIYYWFPKRVVLTNFLERFFPKIITRKTILDKFVKMDQPKYIALTFDDLPFGWHQEIINLLNKYNMKATLFIISSYVTNENKQIFVDAVKNGHQLGNHGKTNRMHARLSLVELEKEIDDCDKIIKSIYEEAHVSLPKKMCYRPGSGFFTNKMIDLAAKKNYHVTLGSVYPHDPFVPFSWINYYYVIGHLSEGDIVILHDLPWTKPMLELLLPWLVSKNYESVTVDRLID